MIVDRIKKESISYFPKGYYGDRSLRFDADGSLVCIMPFDDEQEAEGVGSWIASCVEACEGMRSPQDDVEALRDIAREYLCDLRRRLEVCRQIDKRIDIERSIQSVQKALREGTA